MLASPVAGHLQTRHRFGIFLGLTGRHVWQESTGLLRGRGPSPASERHHSLVSF